MTDPMDLPSSEARSHFLNSLWTIVPVSLAPLSSRNGGMVDYLEREEELWWSSEGTDLVANLDPPNIVRPKFHKYYLAIALDVVNPPKVVDPEPAEVSQRFIV